MNPLLAQFESQLIPEHVLAEGIKSGKWTPKEVDIYIRKVEYPRVWKPANEAAKDKDIKSARCDPNAFAEYVMTDKQGKPFKQERAHREIQVQLARAFETGLKRLKTSKTLENEIRNLMILMPPGAGKSMQLVSFNLWMLGQDQTLTCAYLTETFSVACQFVGMMASIIHQSPLYREVFPEVQLLPPVQNIGKPKQALHIKRKIFAADPAIVAAGLDQQIESRRWDVVTPDDISTRKTAYSQQRRESGKRVFRESVMTRLNPDGGFFCGLGQKRHDEDVISWIIDNTNVHVVSVPIMEDMNDYATCNFPTMFSESAISERKKDMTTFLVYDMLQSSDPEEQKRREEAVQIAIDRAEFEGRRLYEHYVPKPNEIIVAGFDLPHKKKRKGGKPADSLAGYVQRYDPVTGDQITLGLRMQKGGIFEILEFIVKMCRDFGLTLPGPRMIVVENVGAQDYVNQIFTDEKKGIVKTCPEFRRLKVEAYTTNEDTKFYDIPSVHTLYENSHEVLPDSELTQSYKGGLIGYQTGDHPHDLLMARVCADHGIELLREKYKGMYSEGVMTDQKSGNDNGRKRYRPAAQSMNDPGTAAVVGAVY